MNTADQGIRKAAILASSLDRAAADAMLERLSPDQARRVRQMMVDLDAIDAREQRRVIDEFFRCGPGRRDRHPPGVELGEDAALPQRSVARRSAAVQRSADDRQTPAAPPRPFRFLQEAEGEKLARVLAAERPQTVALVLAHLPSEQAGGVLARLEPAAQVAVIHRLVELEETDPEILREVERALESRLSQQVHMQRRRVAGLKAVNGILEASGKQVAEQILGNLAAYDQPLAERLSPSPLGFEDLARLDDGALLTLFRAAEPEPAMTALVGAPPELINRILRRFAAPEAKTIRQRLDHPGPIRLSDVETARQELADLAQRLVSEGRIQVPAQTTLAAA